MGSVKSNRKRLEHRARTHTTREIERRRLEGDSQISKFLSWRKLIHRAAAQFKPDLTKLSSSPVIWRQDPLGFGDMFEDFGSYAFTGTSKLRMPYRLLVPKDLKASTRYPLVLFFHGSGERGDDNQKQLQHGVRRFAAQASQTGYACFVLAPQCPTDLDSQPTMWTGERERMHLLKLAPEAAIPLRTALELMTTIQEKLPVDMDRVYVTGISM